MFIGNQEYLQIERTTKDTGSVFFQNAWQFDVSNIVMFPEIFETKEGAITGLHERLSISKSQSK